MADDFKVTVREEDGAYWATMERFPGVFATGDTLDELRESLQEGIALWLAKPGQEPPKVELGELRLDGPLHAGASAALAFA